MVKKRVHELAKELQIESKEVIQRLLSLGVPVKTHMSTVDDQDIKRLFDELGKAKGTLHVRRKEELIVPPGKIEQREEIAQRKGPAEIIVPKERRESKFSDQGPGLVDRVPSRPPDRRFQERPFTRSDIFPGRLTRKPAVSPEAEPKERAQKPVEPKPQVFPKTGPVPEVKKEPAQRPGPAYPKRYPLDKPGEKGKLLAPEVDKKVVLEKEPRPKLKPLKVPKAPEELKVQVKAQEKAKRGERSPGKSREARDWLEDKEEQVVERKHRFLPGEKKKRQKEGAAVAPAEKKPIVIGEIVTVQELASKMKKSAAELIKKLMSLGVIATINQDIDHETATIVAAEFGYETQVKFELDAEAILNQDQEDDPSKLQPRSCVVTVMGHVDHGKTSLLDAIRKTNVTATEVGGITQHIGAYQVEHNNKKITFIDTPGHEAFTAMRARGASITDIAVLVVAADDGIMPQTVEAIDHAKAAKIPIIVAINKIDKPEADVERVKRQLTEYELVPEEWGGQTICVPVSAKTGQGLKDLLEVILLMEEISDLKANPSRSARGAIIEAELDKGRGPVATVLVQNGTLNIGDNIVAGTAAGRVRAMTDHMGRRVKGAGPSMPVEVLGFSEVPQAGDILHVVSEERLARQIAARRILRKREETKAVSANRVSLEDLFKQIKEGQVKELNLVLKADTQGSVEALKHALEGLSTNEVRVNIIHGGVGLISETDVLLASASRAIVLGFNVKVDMNTRRAADIEKVDIRTYRVIYDVINDVKAAMSGLLEPEYRQVVVGRAEIRKIFKVSRIGTIAGCYVKEGKLVRDAKVKLTRDGTVVYEGKLNSLKRFKDDVREVQEGYECGIALEGYNDLQEGDLLESFTTETIKRELT